MSRHPSHHLVWKITIVGVIRMWTYTTCELQREGHSWFYFVGTYYLSGSERKLYRITSAIHEVNNRRKVKVRSKRNQIMIYFLDLNDSFCSEYPNKCCTNSCRICMRNAPAQQEKWAKARTTSVGMRSRHSSLDRPKWRHDRNIMWRHIPNTRRIK